MDVFYGDESGFSPNCVIPYAWQFPNEPITILPQKGKTIKCTWIYECQWKSGF